MKIKLEIELEMPDQYKDWPMNELHQLIFDSYVNYATCKHLDDVLQWMVDAKDSKTVDYIIDMHKEWGKICASAQFKVKVVP